jgi:hypothetical protein
MSVDFNTKTIFVSFVEKLDNSAQIVYLKSSILDELNGVVSLSFSTSSSRHSAISCHGVLPFSSLVPEGDSMTDRIII